MTPPGEDLPEVSIGDVQDVLGGLVGMLRRPRAYVDSLRVHNLEVDGHFICDHAAGRHCDHWMYMGSTCCKCHGTTAMRDTCKW